MGTDQKPDGRDWVASQPAPVPFDRLDVGDAAQRAEMEGGVDPDTDEPLELVDAPVQVEVPLAPAGEPREHP